MALLVAVLVSCSSDARRVEVDGPGEAAEPPRGSLPEAAQPEVGVPPSLRAAYVTAVQASAPEAYRLHWDPAKRVVQADCPAQQWRIELEAGRARVSSLARGASADARIDLAWVAVGRGAALASVEEATDVRIAGNRVTFSRGADVDEWYANGPLGLEHGVVLGAAPGGAAETRTEELTLQVRFSPNLAAELHEGWVALRSGDGILRARYGELFARDAQGRALDSWLELSDGAIELHVDDHGASYPVTIDPLVWIEENALLPLTSGAAAELGRGVALDGSTALVGAPGDPSLGVAAGAAMVFVKVGDTWLPQQKLLASDGAAGDGFGRSVALSGDTALVGSWLDDDGGSDSGSAYVFVRSGGVWTQQAKLTASDGASLDYLGGSVALSGDTALLGAGGDDDGGSESGAAYVFVRSGGVWSEQSKLTASDPDVLDRFGVSVALDGDTALVGAYFDDDAGVDSGSAYVFVRSGGVWSEQDKLVASDGAAGDQLGNSLALSGDTALVGAYTDDDAGVDSGSAYVFVRSGGVWSEQEKLVASDGAAGDQFGNSLALLGDTALIGAWFDDDAGGNAGSVYVFERAAGIWSETTKILAADEEADDRYGVSVALSADGALVGSYHDHQGGVADVGAAYVLSRSGGAWLEEQKLGFPDGSVGATFGAAVSIDGDRAVVGAPSDDTNGSDAGAAYVFARSSGLWVQEQKLLGVAPGDRHGTSVSVSGITVVVGAHAADVSGANSGAANVYVRSGGVWIQQAELAPVDGAADDYFGVAVSLDGDTAVVGAHGDDDNGGVSGSAYVFVRTGGVWSQQQKLLPADGSTGDYFGYAVCVDGDTVLAGSHYDDDHGSNSGSAYVFVRSGGVWSPQQKLSAADGAVDDFFGQSLALSADTALVGAPGDDDAGAESGSGYVFVRSGGTWALQQKLVAADGAAGDDLGWAVGLSGDRAVLGARGDDDRGVDAGAAYPFARSGGTWSQEGELAPANANAGDRLGSAVALSGASMVVGAPGANVSGVDSGSTWVFSLKKDNGDPCGGGGECASGICVDSVCCDAVCGAGVANDCQACSVAAGASVDGVCGPSTGNGCDDGLFCTVTDTCQAGVCAGNGDPCPGADGDGDCAESCDEAADSCTSPDPNGSSCSDGSFCNGGETCTAGVCSDSAGDPCPGPDGDGDCAESCDEAADSCTAADADGSGCDDGAFCTGTDSCQAGTCTSAGDPCPGADGDGDCAESCDEAADSCTAADVDGSGCDDGAFCSGADSCQAGTCTGAGDPCPGPDGDEDCAESCDEASDSCTGPDTDGSACDDGAFCTDVDSCQGGICEGSGDPCPGPDGDEDCAESCDELGATCTAPDPSGAACDDGAYCNGSETCSAGVCGGSNGDPCPGPDGDEDCAESCDETSDACVGPDVDGALCGEAGLCQAGSCRGTGGEGGGTSSGGGVDPAADDGADDGGCGCRLAGPAAPSRRAGWLELLVLGLLLRRWQAPARRRARQ